MVASARSQRSAAPNKAIPKNSLTRRESLDPATLDLHDDRYNERSAPRTFLEETPELDADLFFDKPLIGAFLHARSLNDVANQLRSFPQQIRAPSVLSQAPA